MSLRGWDGVWLDVACDVGPPRAIREALRASEELAAVRDDVLLVASELVGLVVRDNPVDGAVLHFVAEPDERGVMLQAQAPRAAEADADLGGEARFSPRRLGLQIIDRLAERWDVERNGSVRAWALLTVSWVPPA
jgi:hypothetical protein